MVLRVHLRNADYRAGLDLLLNSSVMNKIRAIKTVIGYLIECPNCKMLHAVEEYECERCGWEFGFETHSPDDDDDDETMFNLDDDGQPIL